MGSGEMSRGRQRCLGNMWAVALGRFQFGALKGNAVSAITASSIHLMSFSTYRETHMSRILKDTLTLKHFRKQYINQYL
jgi:hypothetical protein